MRMYEITEGEREQLIELLKTLTEYAQEFELEIQEGLSVLGYYPEEQEDDTDESEFE